MYSHWGNHLKRQQEHSHGPCLRGGKTEHPNEKQRTKKRSQAITLRLWDEGRPRKIPTSLTIIIYYIMNYLLESTAGLAANSKLPAQNTAQALFFHTFD